MVKKPLSILSFDKTNSITVCDYSNEFIDLDESKAILRKKHSPNSPDMLYIDDKKKEIWFVEFKSSNKRNLSKIDEKIKLKKKIFAGLFLIYEISCPDGCKYINYDRYYFVVFDKEKIDGFEDEFLSLGDELNPRIIEFGLEDLKPQFLKDVFTENCESLITVFQRRFNIEFIKEKNEQE